MPWNLPSLTSSQVSNFKSFLGLHGFQAIGRHYHKDISAYFSNDEVALVNEYGIGEHVFAAVYYPERASAVFKTIVNRVPEAEPSDLVAKAERFISAVVADLDAYDLTLVGFTATHVQLMASLCVARELKTLRSSIKILIGGLHFDEKYSLALLRHFEEFDFVCVGEGETPFLHLASSLRGDGQVAQVPRLAWRSPSGIVLNADNGQSLVCLAELPLPDISDYFTQSLLPGLEMAHAKVCVESARGCSWGKCTFCIEGIRRAAGYRVKQAAQVAQQVLDLTTQARTVDVVFTDPDMSGRRDVFEAITASGYNYRIEAEVSGLVDLSTLLAMRDAGMRSVQIGIESFSPALIRRFAKGVKLIHYIELMRWTRSLGIDLTYNIIVGAPFETQQDINISADNMKHLWFLSPPIISEFVVSVGSPIHKNYHRFGIDSLSSLPETECYPERIRNDLGPLLSFHAGFGYTISRSEDTTVEHDPLVRAVERWWEYARSGADCKIFAGPGFADIEYRVGDVIRHLKITDPTELAVLYACRTFARSLSEISSHIAGIADQMSTDSLSAVLATLVERGLLFASDNAYLTLPLTAAGTVEADGRVTSFDLPVSLLPTLGV